MDIVLSVVATALLWWTGLGIAAVLTDTKRSGAIIEFAALGLLFGSVAVALLMFLFGNVASTFARGSFLTISCLLLGCSGILIFRRQSRWLIHGELRNRNWLAALLLIAVQTGFIVWLSLRQTLGWDGLVVWELKAHLICLENGSVPTAYLSDPTRRWSHPMYPPLIPFNIAWLYSWLGRCDQYYAKLAFPAHYLASSLIMLVLGARLGGRMIFGILPVLLLPFVPAIIVGDGSATSGYADFPLAVFYVTATLYIFEYWKTGSRHSFTIAALVAGFMPWVKQEGTLLWLCIGLLTLIAVFHQKHVLWFSFFIIPGIVVMGSWRLFLQWANAYESEVFRPFTVNTFIANMGRASDIVSAVIIELMNVERWSILWLWLAFIFLMAIIDKMGRLGPLLPVAAIAPLACYSFVFFFSSWEPVKLHLDSALPRLLIHVSLVALVAIGLGCPVVSFSVLRTRSGKLPGLVRASTASHVRQDGEL